MIILDSIPHVQNSPYFIVDYQQNKAQIEDGDDSRTCMALLHFKTHINFVAIVFYLMILQKIKLKKLTLITCAILVINMFTYSFNRI